MRMPTPTSKAKQQDNIGYTPREHAGRRTKYVTQYATQPHNKKGPRSTHEGKGTTATPPPTKEHTRYYPPHA